MMYKSHFWILFVVLLFGLTACSPQANPTVAAVQTTAVPAALTSEPVQETFDDPFAYCAAVGTIDAPDARYTGPQVSDAIINGFKIAAGLENSTEPLEMLRKTTIWRCMDQQVYACNFGANLPCDSKANTDKTPSTAMEDYCQANPDSEVIPMSVTGHDTIYSWHCVESAPELLDQIDEVDAAGYLARIWYPIQPDLGLGPGSGPVASPTLVPTETPASPAAPLPALPGGNFTILFGSNRGGPYEDLYLMDTSSRETTRLTAGDANTFPGPFSPDGSQILFTGFGLIHSYVGVMNADGSQARDLSQSPDSDEGFPAWSPDGSRITFTSRRDGNNEIYVMNVDGSQPKRLTTNPTDDFAPSWSPDGLQIAFVSDRDNATGVNNLYVMNADGSNVRRLTNGPEINYSPAWSPDGVWIAFRAHHDGPADIYLIKPDGSDLLNLTNHAAEDWAPAWSPDGSWLAFQTNRDGNWEIYVMQVDGSSLLNLTQNPADDQMPYWAPGSAASLANPASVNCVDQGGTLAIEQRGELGDFGVCYFEDNRQCEEWALLRGDCPVGGLKVTGYITEAARFCAITGGEYAVTDSSNTDTEQGTCAFKNGKTCDVWAYYYGSCGPND